MTSRRPEGRPGTPGLPYFAASPVVEVAMSVAFRPIVKLRVAELVLAWERLFGEQFPNLEEQPTYEMPTERFSPATGLPGFSFQFGTTVPTPKLLLVNELGNEVIQLQSNWFARNWRKTDADPDYVRYPNLREPFEKNLTAFASYIREREFGELQPTQCELSYVNHISSETGAEADLGDILTPLAHPQDRPASLRPIESLRFGAQFVIDHEDKPVGRVSLSADPATRMLDGASIVVLNVTARGGPLGEGISGSLAFLDLAHEHAVRAFDASTRPEMHRQWGRKI